MNKQDDMQFFLETVMRALDYAEHDNAYAGNFYKAYNSGTRTLFQRQKTEIKKFDDAWIKTLESYFPSLNRIMSNLRSNIKYQREILPIEKTKRITRESIIHLTAHTHFIQEINEEGILPKKILSSLAEAEYGIYENRFIMTLVTRLKDYVAKRVKLIKQQLQAERVIHLDALSTFKLDNADYDMHIEIKRKEQVAIRKADEHNQEVLKRSEKLYKLISRLFYSSFMQIMKQFQPVSAPIMKTQVILKNPDFKNAYYLWLYLDKTTSLGFDIEVKTINKRFAPAYIKQLNQMHLTMLSVLATNSNFVIGGGLDKTRKRKAKVLTKLPGETELLPEAFDLESPGLSEYYLNKSRQVLKQQLDKNLEETGDEKVALRQALEETMAITNSLYESYFAINADVDVFERLIQESDPEQMLADVKEKLEVSKIVREVKEKEYNDSLELEAKWQKEYDALREDFEEALEEQEVEAVFAQEKVEKGQDAMAIEDEFADKKAVLIPTGPKTILKYSLQARLHLADERTLDFYDMLKNHILSYRGVRNNISFKQETFVALGKLVLKLRLQGKTMRLYFGLNSKDFEDTKYNLKDISNFTSHATTPSLFTVRGSTGIKHAMQLIDIWMKQKGIEKNQEYKAVDYKQKKMSKYELIQIGLIKTNEVDFLESEEQ